MVEFKVIRYTLENQPMTHYPALLTIVIQECVKRKVFKDKEAIVTVVKRILKDL